MRKVTERGKRVRKVTERGEEGEKGYSERCHNTFLSNERCKPYLSLQYQPFPHTVK